MFVATSTNTGAITISDGVSNGYELLGANFVVALKPKQRFLLYCDDSAPTVGSSAKTIDLAGTGTETISVVVVYG